MRARGIKVDCPYCGKQAEYRDSEVVYGKSYGMIYICLACDAYVGVHKGTNQPLGTLANRRLRELRKQAHKEFDKLWRMGTFTRSQAYEWLAQTLKLPPDEAHIGRFNEDQCLELINKL